MNNKEIFNTGIIVGRFQHLHIGHEKIINVGLALCERLLIFIGSASSEPTSTNPYSVEYRTNLIAKVYEEEINSQRIILCPLDDFKNKQELSPKWGRYVINSATEKLGQAPECIIYGKDKNIFKCFDKLTVKNITEILVDRKQLEISATEIRTLLLNSDKEMWKKYVNVKIHDEYDKLKQIVENVNK